MMFNMSEPTSRDEDFFIDTRSEEFKQMIAEVKAAAYSDAVSAIISLYAPDPEFARYQ